MAVMTLEPRSKRATVVPTALFWTSVPVAISVIEAKRCPAFTTKPIKLNNVTEGSLKGNI